MLTKRAQILFDENLWKNITNLARARKTSAGEIVREAVKEKLSEEEKFARRVKAIESTYEHRVVSKGKINYKELINYGRKY